MGALLRPQLRRQNGSQGANAPGNDSHAQDPEQEFQNAYGNRAAALLDDPRVEPREPPSRFRELLYGDEDPGPEGHALRRVSNVLGEPTVEADSPEQEIPSYTEADTERSSENQDTSQVSRTDATQESASETGEQHRESEETTGETAEEPEETTEEVDAATPQVEVIPGEAAQRSSGGGGSGGGGGGGASEGPDPLAAWQSSVSGAAATIPNPELDANDQASSITSTGGQNAQGQRQRQQGIRGSAENVLPEVPEPEEPLPPPPPDPVPEATNKVAAASDKRLPDQTLPALQRSPGGNIPTTGSLGRLNAAEGFEPPPPEPAESEGEAAGQRNPDQEQADEVRERNEQAQEEEAQEASGEAVTLTDTGEPPAPEAPEERKEDIAKVLARIIANSDQEVETMLTQARSAAYPRQTLNEVYPDIGNDKKPELTADLNKEMDRVREQSGISKDALDAEVRARQDELAELEETAQGEVETAHEQATEEVREAGKENINAVEGESDAMANRIDATADSGEGAADPEIINGKRDRLIKRVEGKVARQIAGYRSAKTQRDTALDRAAGQHARAYRDTGEREAREIVNQAGSTSEEQTAALDQAAARRGWATERTRELEKLVRQFKRDVDTTSNGYRTDIQKAGTEAKELIRAWAEEQTGEQRSWWERFIDMLKDWLGQAEANREEWEVATAIETRDAIVSDFDDLDRLLAMAQEGVDLGAMAQRGELTEEQLAILTAYFMGPEKGDSIAAVAAALRMRINKRWKPKLIEGFESEILDKPASHWQKLEALGATQGSGFNASSLGMKAYDAMHGGLTEIGTDEEQLFGALQGLTKLQGAAVRKYYQHTYHRSLDDDLESELSGHEYERAQAQIEGRWAEADAAELREAMDGGLTGWGTDEEAIHNLLRGKSDSEREAIIEAYNRMYGRNLSADLDDEMDDEDQDRADAYLDGNVALGDAIALEAAMNGGLTGWGTDEDAIEKVYKDIRADVAAQAQREGWSTARMEAEIRRRNGEVEGAFNTKYGENYPDAGEEGALRAAFDSELSYGELELANALADADETRADAARMRIEMNSFVTDDDAVNEILGHQYERALEDLRRDNWPRIEHELQERARSADPPWTPLDWERERRLATRRLEDQAQVASAGYMQNLEDAYDAREWGAGALRLDIAFNTMGTNQDQALTLLDQGYLTPVQAIDFAVDGAGTNEALLRKTLEGRTDKEVQEIREAWERAHPGESFDDRIMEETGIWGYGGGREGFDTQLLLEGEPTDEDGNLDPAAQLERAKRRYQWEMDNIGLGGLMAGPQRQALRNEIANMEQAQQMLADPNLTPAQRTIIYGQFERRKDGVDTGIEMYRKQVDALSDAAANAVGAIVAIGIIVVGIVGGFFTGGATTVAAFAAVGALISAAAVMATKAVMKGGAYSADEIATDAAMGIVDAIVSAATAGLGDKLLMAGRLAMLASKGKAGTIIAKLISEGAENLVQSGVTATVGTALDDKIWESSDSLGAFATSVGAQTAMGTGMGLGMGRVMEAGMPAVTKLVGKFGGKQAGDAAADAIPGDILARRGTPEERLALFHQAQQANPNLTKAEFLRQLDEGIIDAADIDAAIAGLHKNMRGELLSGIPPELRSNFTQTPIEVLGDADFIRMTGSTTGHAAVIIENGQLRVVIREGAPMSALREEGIHLQQSLDAEIRAKMAELDEARLANWEDLPLDEQIRLYNLKLDIELDGQRLLINNLSDSLEDAGLDDATRKALQRQLDEAQATLDNLNARRAEVDAISPESHAAIASGSEQKPEFLDQRPRLFAKKDDVRESVLGAFEGAAKADQESATKVLDDLRNRVKYSKDKKLTEAYAAFATKVDDLAQNDPAALRSFVEGVGKMLDARNAPDVAGFLTASSKMADPGAFLAKAQKLAAKDSGIAPSTLQEMSNQIATLNPKVADNILDLAVTLKADIETGGGLDAFYNLRKLATDANLGDEGQALEQMLLKMAGDLDSTHGRNLEGLLWMIDKYPSKYSFENPPELPDGHTFVRKGDGWGIQRGDGSSARHRLDDEGNFEEIKVESFDQKSKKWREEQEAQGLQLDEKRHKNLSQKVDDLPKNPPEMNGYSPDDIAAVTAWADVIEEMHKRLEPDGEAFLDRLFKDVQPPFTDYGYKKFRRQLRDEIVDHAIWKISPRVKPPGELRAAQEQWQFIKKFLEEHPDPRLPKAPDADASGTTPAKPTKIQGREPERWMDPASRGELFSSFREARLKHGSSTPTGSKSIKHIEDAPRKVGSSDRMIDGQMDVEKDIVVAVTDDGEIYSVPPGRYAVEDKAGGSAFNPKQAKEYSEDLKKGMLVADQDGKKQKMAGIIYVFDDSKAAMAAANTIKDLDDRIFIAFVGSDGQLKFVDRSSLTP